MYLWNPVDKVWMAGKEIIITIFCGKTDIFQHSVLEKNKVSFCKYSKNPVKFWCTEIQSYDILTAYLH